MKILYYSPHPHLNLTDPTGYGTHMREIIEAFRQLGHEVFPLIIGGDTAGGDRQLSPRTIKGSIKKMIPSILWESIKDYRLFNNDYHYARELEKAVKKFKPDIIYERGAYLQNSGRNVAEKFDIKYIVEVNAPYIEERVAMQGRSVFLGKADKMEGRKISYADKVVVVSSALKEHLISSYGIDNEKIIITPNAISPNAFEVDQSLKKELAEKYSISQNNIVIGFVGSIFPYHGVDTLIRSFASVAEKEEAIKLLIVGGGESLPTLKALAKALHKNDRIFFTGNISADQVFSYIDLMDITVMARSNWYGSPVKIFEYGVLGKAIIAPDNVPVKDVMENEVDALLIGQNESELVKALKRLVASKELREKLGNSFREKVQTRHTWGRMAGKILNSL